MFKNFKLKKFCHEKPRGQSVVEYILLVTAVLILMIVFLGKNGAFKSNVENTLNSTVDSIDNLRNEIDFNYSK